MSPKDILASAKKSGFPQNASYHTGLTVAFASMAQAALALKHAEVASKDGSSSWVAPWFRARAYAGRFQFEQALYWAQKTREYAPDSRYVFDESVVVWHLNSGDADGALNLIRETYYHHDNDSTETQRSYLKCLSLKRDTAGLMKVLRDLNEKMFETRPYSQLTNLLTTKNLGAAYCVSSWARLGQVYMFCGSEKERKFILDVIQKGQNDIFQNEGEAHQIRWLNRYASFVYCYIEDGGPKAIQIFSSNISRIKESKMLTDEDDRTELLFSTYSYCASYAYGLAVEQEKSGSSDLQATVKVMADLAHDAQWFDRANMTMERLWHSYDAQFQYGGWLRRHLPKNNESWRTFMRKPLLLFLDQLDDTKPENDAQSIRCLMMLLLHVGDTTRYGALLALVLLRLDMLTMEAKDQRAANSIGEVPQFGKTAEDEKVDASTEGMIVSQITAPLTSTKSNTATTNEYLLFDIVPEGDKNDVDNSIAIQIDVDVDIFCSSCWSYLGVAKKFYVCQTCQYYDAAALCEKCVPTDRLNYQFGYACGNHHESIQVWPIPKDIANLAAVRKGKQIRMRRSFLEEIRNEWKDAGDEDDTGNVQEGAAVPGKAGLVLR